MTLNCKGQLIDLALPKVMGILNVTPNSFYHGGKFADEKALLNQVEKMLNEGSTFIDIGGYSSKPNAEFVSEEEELQRVIPIVTTIIQKFPETLILPIISNFSVGIVEPIPTFPPSFITATIVFESINCAIS